jgi:hypothetical protein
MALRLLIAAITQNFLFASRLDFDKTARMKCAAVAMAVYIAFASQAFAVLRPLFPAKAGPPFGVEAIVKGNGSVPPLVKRAPATVPR